MESDQPPVKPLTRIRARKLKGQITSAVAAAPAAAVASPSAAKVAPISPAAAVGGDGAHL